MKVLKPIDTKENIEEIEENIEKYLVSAQSADTHAPEDEEIEHFLYFNLFINKE